MIIIEYQYTGTIQWIKYTGELNLAYCLNIYCTIRWIWIVKYMQAADIEEFKILLNLQSNLGNSYS